MNSVGAVFDALGGPSQVARLLGLRPSTASEMKRRGSIPSEYWAELVEAARSRRIMEIDSERLMAIHSRGAARDGLVVETTMADGAPAERPGLAETATPYHADAGHFGRLKHLRRSNFRSLAEIDAHVGALRGEWDRR